MQDAIDFGVFFQVLYDLFPWIIAIVFITLVTDILGRAVIRANNALRAEREQRFDEHSRPEQR